MVAQKGGKKIDVRAGGWQPWLPFHGGCVINRSQIHECGNWEWGCAVSFLRIFVSNFWYSVFVVRWKNVSIVGKEILCAWALTNFAISTLVNDDIDRITYRPGSLLFRPPCFARLEGLSTVPVVHNCILNCEFCSGFPISLTASLCTWNV